MKGKQISESLDLKLWDSCQIYDCFASSMPVLQPLPNCVSPREINLRQFEESARKTYTTHLFIVKSSIKDQFPSYASSYLKVRVKWTI